VVAEVVGVAEPPVREVAVRVVVAPRRAEVVAEVVPPVATAAPVAWSRGEVEMAVGALAGGVGQPARRAAAVVREVVAVAEPAWSVEE